MRDISRQTRSPPTPSILLTVLPSMNDQIVQLTPTRFAVSMFIVPTAGLNIKCKNRSCDATCGAIQCENSEICLPGL